MSVLTAVIISFLLTLSYRTIPHRVRSSGTRQNRRISFELGPFGRIRRYYIIQLLTHRNPPRQTRRQRIQARIQRTRNQAHHQPGFVPGPFTPLREAAPPYQARDLPLPVPGPPRNIWNPNQDNEHYDVPNWEAARIEINRIIRERENLNPPQPRGASPVIPPRPDTPHPVLDPRLRRNAVTEYVETLIPIEPPVLTEPVVDSPIYRPVTPEHIPESVVSSRSATPVQIRPLNFDPSIIYHHKIHEDGIPLVTVPTIEPATRGTIWSYCTEHRLFEELRSGEQHNETAVVLRGICPEDAIRTDVNIANLATAFSNLSYLRENRNYEKKLSSEIYDIQIHHPEQLHSEYVRGLTGKIERARIRIIYLSDYERFGPTRIRFYDYLYQIARTPSIAPESDDDSDVDPNDIFLEYPVASSTSEIQHLNEDSDKENRDPNNGVPTFVEGSSQGITIPSTRILNDVTEENQEQKET